jgi:hypothetical protein
VDTDCVRRPEAFDDGYIVAYWEIQVGIASAVEAHLCRRIKMIDNATSRRSYILCLIDHGYISLSFANRILGKTAESHYKELGIPDCYFQQPRPI